MGIVFEYLLKNQANFSKFEISFNEYFDLDENEKVEINSVPKFSQPYQYLEVELKDILLLNVCFEINQDKRTFKQIFWNEGNNILTERIDNGSENYRELILSIKTQDLNDSYETLRLFVGEKYIVPVYHSMIKQNSNGNEIENKINTDVFIEMIKNGYLR